MDAFPRSIIRTVIGNQTVLETWLSLWGGGVQGQGTSVDAVPGDVMPTAVVVSGVKPAIVGLGPWLSVLGATLASVCGLIGYVGLIG